MFLQANYKTKNTNTIVHRQLSRKFVDALLMLFAIFFTVPSIQAAAISANIQHADDVTHVEFLGRSDWEYQIQRGDGVISAKLPSLDDKTKVQMQGWNSGFVKKISVTKDVEGRDQVTFELVSKDIQVFDYQTDQPSRLILDFFKKDPELEAKPAVTSQVAPKEASAAAKKVAAKLSPKLPPKLSQKKSADRKPAGTDFIEGEKASAGETDVTADVKKESETLGVFDGSDPDYNRFKIASFEIREEAKIAAMRNPYLDFPRVKTQSDFLEEFIKKAPLYEVKPEESAENKEARLLTTLFTKKRHAVFLKALAMFRDKFPETQYDELVRYLEADTYYALWLKDHANVDFEKAITLYKKNVEKFPTSKIAERTLFLVLHSQLDKGDFLSTIESYIRIKEKFPDSKYMLQAKMSAADAYAGLNRVPEAVSLLSEIENDPKAKGYAADAAFRIADRFYDAKNYVKAIESYKRAIEKYPNDLNRLPSSFYNLAEAQFKMKDYVAANDNYREFLKRYPSHDHCGFALTRVGEILDILGAKENKVKGAFLETTFRFPSSEGAKVARVHLMSKRMSEMTDREVTEWQKELEQLMKSTTLTGFQFFSRILLTDGYFKRKRYDESIAYLTDWYKKQEDKRGLEFIPDRIIRNISRKLSVLANEGKSVETIRTYGQFHSEWLAKSGRLDVNYFLAKGYENTSLTKEAERLYQETLNKIYSMEPEEAKQRAVFEELPSSDELNLHLASTSIEQDKLVETQKYLKDIKTVEKLSPVDLIRHAEVSSELATKQGNASLAILHLQKLVDTWKGQPSAVSGIYLKLAGLQMKAGANTEAENSLKKIVYMEEDTKNVGRETHIKAMQMLSQLYLKKKENTQAVGVLKKILDMYETESPLGSVRYQAGDILYKMGDVKGAENLWLPMKDREDYRAWYKLAKEKLESDKWNDNYKKYLNRIPAAAGIK